MRNKRDRGGGGGGGGGGGAAQLPLLNLARLYMRGD